MQGLTSGEASERLKEYGFNVTEQKKKSQPFKVFIGQFKDVMVMILLAATVISAILGEVWDAVTIILIVLLNAILGFIQEFRTEKTLETLKKLSAPNAKCMRDGRLQVIPSAEIVPGDIIRLETGDKVSADAVIIECNSLNADESILTGESVPASKCVAAVDDNDNSLNKPNIVYAGTNITRGNATAKVIGTGKNSQIGKISSMLGELEQGETPLQKRLGELGKVVAIICVAVCIIVFGAGMLRGEPFFEMLMTGITIAIAAIPEGLPATVTITLALAVGRMLKQKALVNRLHSVETLGCTSVICSDKTGTITENKMTVKAVYAGGTDYAVSGNGHKIAGEILLSDGGRVNPKAIPELTALLECGVICTTSMVSSGEINSSRNRDNSGSFTVVGDPTETAILIASAKGGVTAESLRFKYTKTDEIPFDSERKYMTIFAENSGKEVTAFTKGAFDVILPKCAFIQSGKEVTPMTRTQRREIEEKASWLASQALRVIAFAKKSVSGGNNAGDLTFLGLMGMIDPPRREAIDAINLCAHSKIKTVMITGDHKNTAAAIARQAGILKGNAEVITGAELDKMSDDTLFNNLDRYAVFARVDPSHKLRLVRAYKRKGHIVTMTGDGVNDAPAIKEADVGVAMGLTGTDVAKEAADVVLLDDNFATLVRAVEQGRNIYANIRKFVRYLLSCNIGEVLTMFIGILMGFPIVLLPVQILLVNLVTDGLPALALSLEPPEKNTMRKAPRGANESFFNGGLLSRIIFRGIMIGLCTLGCFSTILRMGFSEETARTCALLTLVISQLAHVFECKSESGNIFTVKYWNNPQLLLAVFISALVIFTAIYIPTLQIIFGTIALTGKQLLISAMFALIIPLINVFGKKKI